MGGPQNPRLRRGATSGARVCVALITQASRASLVRDCVLPSVLAFRPHEILVVGDFREGAGYRYLPVPAVTRTTLDGLMKRDVALAATDAEIIIYLCDDHCFIRDWCEPFVQWIRDNTWDMLVPRRSVMKDGLPTEVNNGMKDYDPMAPYVGGHCGIYRTALLRQRPWLTTAHHPNWDLWHTRDCVSRGARLVEAADLWIEDVEPGSRPWL